MFMKFSNGLNNKSNQEIFSLYRLFFVYLMPFEEREKQTRSKFSLKIIQYRPVGFILYNL